MNPVKETELRGFISNTSEAAITSVLARSAPWLPKSFKLDVKKVRRSNTPTQNFEYQSENLFPLGILEGCLRASRVWRPFYSFSFQSSQIGHFDLTLKDKINH